MSQVKISGNASGTGVLTIAAPNTNVDRTLTLPDSAGEIVTNKSTPIFVAYLGSTQSIGSGTFTKLNIDTEVVDSEGWYDHTTNYRFTPQQAGYYFVEGLVYYQFMQNNVAVPRVYKNGAATGGVSFNRFQATSSITDAEVGGSGIVYANGSTDYFELYAFQDYGSNRDVYNGGSWATRFSGYLIKAT